MCDAPITVAFLMFHFGSFFIFSRMCTLMTFVTFQSLECFFSTLQVILVCSTVRLDLSSIFFSSSLHCSKQYVTHLMGLTLYVDYSLCRQVPYSLHLRRLWKDGQFRHPYSCWIHYLSAFTFNIMVSLDVCYFYTFIGFYVWFWQTSACL